MFRLSELKVVDYCNEPAGPSQHLFHMNFDNPSQFYLSIAILSLLFNVIALLFYAKFWQKYHLTTDFVFPVTFNFGKLCKYRKLFLKFTYNISCRDCIQKYKTWDRIGCEHYRIWW